MNRASSASRASLARFSRRAGHRTIASYEHELAERRGTEIRLRGALAREEALLHQKDELLNHREILSREADHRLMNGLQMVVSLLSLQSRGETDARAAAHLSAAANRVATIARIHRRLHSLDGVAVVAFKQFIDELCHDYSAMLTAEDRRNRGIVVEGVEARLPAATAIPLSLIATELITNAAKHGRGRASRSGSRRPQRAAMSCRCATTARPCRRTSTRPPARASA